MIAKSIDALPQTKSDAERRLTPEIQRHYEVLLHSLPWPTHTPGTGVRTLGITSCHSGEGVSTVAAHLATAAATLGERRVVLVDANHTGSSVSHMFDACDVPGAISPSEDAGALPDSLQSSGVANLWLLVAASAADGCGLLHERAGMAQMIRELASNFDLVVFDLPAISQSNASLQLAAMLDGVLLVIEADLTSRQDVRDASDRLTRAGGRLLGAVLNKWQSHAPTWLPQGLPF